MADKSSLKEDRCKVLEAVITLLGDANNVFFNSHDNDEELYALRTINFCKRLLSNTDF